VNWPFSCPYLRFLGEDKGGAIDSGHLFEVPFPHILRVASSKKKPNAHDGSLSKRQAAFVREYLIDFNATQAALRAGYSLKAAKQVASRVLTYANVQTAIQSGQQEKAQAAFGLREQVIRELSRIAFGDPRKLMTWEGKSMRLRDSERLTDDDVAQVAEVGSSNGPKGSSVKLKRFDKVKALELLGRHVGLFQEKRDDDGEDDVEAVVVYLPENGR